MSDEKLARALDLLKRIAMNHDGAQSWVTQIGLMGEARQLLGCCNVWPHRPGCPLEPKP